MWLISILFILCTLFLATVTSFQKQLMVPIAFNRVVNRPNSYLKPLYSLEEEIDVDGESYTQRQILKEETEAPFRNVRLYLYLSLIAAASIGSFISITKILATLSGSRNYNWNDLYTNFAINLLGIPVIGYLWKRDLDSKKSILERIKRGGSLAGLKVKLFDTDGEGKASTIPVKLSDLRRDRGIDKRVIIVAAKKELLLESLISSVSISRDIIQNDLLIVPLVINTIESNEYTLSVEGIENFILADENKKSTDHIALPLLIPKWNAVIKREIAVALKQQPDALSKGVTIIIKKNGKVGTRRFGVPIWETLVNDVALRNELGLDVRNI